MSKSGSPVLCLLLAVLASPALAQEATLTLGTATTGGGFEVYGDALARTIADLDPELVVRTRKTAGSMENLELLATDAVDMALVQGEAAHEAFAARSREDSNLRVVAAMYPTAGMFVVRADSPYQSIDDLRGHAVAFGARSSGLVTLARYVLDGIGLDIDRDFVPIMLDRAGDGPALLRDGRVAALWGGGSGWPVFIAAMAAPGGGRFIAPSPDQIMRIRSKYPFLQRQTLPPNAYPGQTSAIESVGSWSLVLARKTLPSGLAYRFCRALHLGATRFAERLPQAQDTKIENTAMVLESREWLHPGAMRCLEEYGAMR
ncbi:MAG: TAXI family TRAP transporter solute-binding subunit [Sulfuritalea sp.]|nr:TAXI family TRAP transporter solute-binding subunit [Sulfuritalea sp.]